MNERKSDSFEGLKPVSIHIGGVFASAHPTLVRTVLGSCIAVCLRDPAARVGGMNHFMLPANAPEESVSARYGVHAMELLINEIMSLGGDRGRLEAKIFGGGHVLKIRESDGNVPQSNIRFAREFLSVENIPITARDLGGYAAREVYFFTETGRVLMKRLPRTGQADDPRLEEMERAERQRLRQLTTAAHAADDSNVTLF